MTVLTGQVFVFGVNSILGWSIARHIARYVAPAQVTLFCNQHTRVPDGAAWRRLNLQDETAVAALFRRERPALIIHCAGICDVEKCETSPEFAYLVNVVGMEVLLRHVADTTRIVHLSTDHVFSGDTGPYTESSPRDPISVHGQVRAITEDVLLTRHERSLVVRPGLWIGPSYNGRVGHLDWLRYRHRRGLAMTLVKDEYRSSVWADDAAPRAIELAMSEVCGIRHIAASRVVSRLTLARYLNQRYAIGARFTTISRAQRHIPHLGRMDLRTEHGDPLAAALRPIVPA